MSEITPRQFIEALEKLKEEYHGAMEGCDLYEFIYWERGRSLVTELIGYIERDAPWICEAYDKLMNVENESADELLKIVIEQQEKGKK